MAFQYNSSNLWINPRCYLLTAFYLQKGDYEMILNIFTKKVIFGLIGFFLCLSLVAIMGAKPIKKQPQKDVRILFTEQYTFKTGGTAGLTRTSTLSTFEDWRSEDISGSKTTTEKMIKEGWSLKQIIPLNSKQFYFLFEK